MSCLIVGKFSKKKTRERLRVAESLCFIEKFRVNLLPSCQASAPSPLHFKFSSASLSLKKKKQRRYLSLSLSDHQRQASSPATLLPFIVNRLYIISPATQQSSQAKVEATSTVAASSNCHLPTQFPATTGHHSR